MEKRRLFQKPGDEYWDIYDENRQLTGRIHRKGDALAPGDYHLVIHVCIFNSKGELLIQQRQPFKKGWPNMWDVSVGGSVQVGETSQMAAMREIREELGLEISLNGVRPHFTVNFPAGFDDFYFVQRDVELSELTLQKEEVKTVRFAAEDEVFRMFEEGIMIPHRCHASIFDMYKEYSIASGEMIRITMANKCNLASWMSLIEIVKDRFPRLETEEELAVYREKVLAHMEEESAICALSGNQVVGILLFSKSRNMVCFMSIHPEYRRRGIAERMVQEMKKHVDPSRKVLVDTFYNEEKRGTIPRAFYHKMGFIEKKEKRNG